MLGDTADLLRQTFGMSDPVSKDHFEKLFGLKPDRTKMPLERFLQEEPLHSIRKAAKELQIPRYSVMEKEELCSALSAELLKPEIIRRRLLSLSTLHLDIFEQALASKKTNIIEGDLTKFLFEDIHDLFYAFIFPDETVTIPYDVADVCRKMDFSDIKKNLEKHE
ncbi:MAG: hypothetical protein II867_04025, partial [Clostridia bacterium]|nr:hypothetical protein [Clostridia bacterium]